MQADVVVAMNGGRLFSFRMEVNRMAKKNWPNDWLNTDLAKRLLAEQ